MAIVQRIRDPIHSLIEFDDGEFEDMIWKVIQSQPFQRLRRVKQLGFSDFVYPGATHSRFAHSVGVYHTARQIIDVIKRKSPRFQQRKAEVALAAALVHDIGHGPFSHAFESVGKHLDLRLAQHELVSDAIIRDSEVTEILNSFDNGFADQVAEVIKSKGPRKIYDTVVSSQFDADRLDYMRRDRAMAGSKHGGIDYDWLVANLEIVDIDVGVDEVKLGSVQTLAVGPKAIAAAEAYVLGLFQLYPTIYFHKTTRGVEKLFYALILRLFELILNNGIRKSGLTGAHPLVKFVKNPSDLSIAQSLDDTVVWGALPLLKEAEDSVVSDLAKRLLGRNLYKAFDVKDEIYKRISSKYSPEEIPDVVDRLAVRALDKIELWVKDKGHKAIIGKYARSPYNKLEESKGPLNQILVKTTSGEVVDLAQISPVVRAIRAFDFIRVYCDPLECSYRGQLSQIVEGEC